MRIALLTRRRRAQSGPIVAGPVIYDAGMGLGAWFFAATYDALLKGVEEAGLTERRHRLLADAAGRVIEIGSGTGVNLPHYGRDVTELVMCEPAPQMARRLRKKAAARADRPLRISADAAEDIHEPRESFDVAVSTLVLCTVKDQRRALSELHRVLRPGGRLIFLEHVRADDPALARWQDRLNVLNRVIAQGCNCNRDTLTAIQASGFEVTALERGEMKMAPPFVRPHIAGTAVRR
jgi:ubiquinone/menaquinone biosynthesis C-methylase UbiE